MQEKYYKSKKQIIVETGLSKATFYRIIRRLGIPISRKLLSPTEAENLREALRSNKSLTSKPDSDTT
jgi:hypothetical protein